MPGQNGFPGRRFYASFGVEEAIVWQELCQSRTSCVLNTAVHCAWSHRPFHSEVILLANGNPIDIEIKINLKIPSVVHSLHGLIRDKLFEDGTVRCQ